MTKEATLQVYSTIGWWTMGIAVLVLAVSPFIRRLMHLDTLEDAPLAGAKEIGEPKAAGFDVRKETR